MSTENRAAVLHGVDDLRLDERPIPTPAADEVPGQPYDPAWVGYGATWSEPLAADLALGEPGPEVYNSIIAAQQQAQR